MTSTRLVAMGFLVCLAVLPAMLMTIARNAAAAESMSLQGASIQQVEGAPPRAWEGQAKPAPKSAVEQQKVRAEEARAERHGPTLIEFYLPEAEARTLSAAAGASAESLLQSFGPSMTKLRDVQGVDPYVGVEAGKRRRAYGRAVADGRELIGPVVVVSGGAITGPDKPTDAWMKEAVGGAAAGDGAIELSLKVTRVQKQASASFKVEFAATGDRRRGLGDDATLNLALIEPVEAGGTVQRVVCIKSLRFPREGSGAVEIEAPGGSKATRVAAIVQHDKTMRLLALKTAEAK